MGIDHMEKLPAIEYRSEVLPGGNPLKGADAWGINMSNRYLMAQRAPDTVHMPSQIIGKINDYGAPIPAGKMSNEGPIGAVSLPFGWTELVPASPPPGTFAFRVRDGQSFVPPDHADNPSVAINIGHRLDPVPPQAEAALRQVLQSKPATYGEQPLTEDEFKLLTGVIGPLDGGNNQFNDLGIHGPKFNVTSASTINIHGETALLVKGNFLNPSGGASGLARETIIIDSNKAVNGIERIYLTAPPEKIRQYEKPLWDTLNTIQWARKNGQ